MKEKFPSELSRARLPLLLSCLLNVLLLVLALRSNQTSPPLDRAPESSSPKAPESDSSVAATEAELPLAFRHVAEGRWKPAIAELRRLGVPASVVQDIVVGAINRRYGPQLVALRQTPDTFWRPAQRGHGDESEAQRELEARAIEGDRNRFLEETLGIDWSTIESSVTGRPDRFEKLTSAVSPRARRAARQVLSRYDAAERDVIRRAGGTIGLPERTELNRLYARKMGELQGFLSAQEVEEIELRTSWTAEHLKQIDLIGFDPTEEEFRAIFRARKIFDEQQAKFERDLATNDRLPMWQAQSELADRLREALGDQRFADYQRSQDYTFRGLVELTEEFDLPNDLAIDVHRLRETYLQRQRDVSQDFTLTDLERQATSHQLQGEARNQVRAILGETAFHRYTQIQIGTWIEQAPLP